MTSVPTQPKPTEIEEFYIDYYHESEGTGWQLGELLRYVPASGGEILDVGCGAARNSMQFRRRGANRVIGIDISRPMIDEAKKVLDEAFLHNLSEPLPFSDHRFDLVYCAMVLEHLFDYMGPLKEMKRVLKPGGRILVEVPNVNYWPNRLLMLLGRNLIWIGVGKHIRAFNIHHLKGALARAGFADVKVIGSILPLPKTALKVHVPYANRVFPGLCYSLIGIGGA
jgi:SAM-dependent methyltransferase